MATKLNSLYRVDGVNGHHTWSLITTRSVPSLAASHARRSPCHFQKRHLSMKELDTDREGRERVVILGSGWAGYALATTLNPKKYQAIVVSPRSYFVFTPLLAESACGTIELRTTVEPVRGKRIKARYIQAWADAVDFTQKSITVEDAVLDPKQGLALTKTTTKQESRKSVSFQVKYDKLVIAVGCYLETFGTPGVKQHARFLKDVGDARKIRTRVLECFEIAASPASTSEIRKQILHFAIVGGGPTGIEYAATLHDLIFEDLRRLYPELMNEVSITIYDVAPTVLSMFDTKLAEYAQQTLKRENIKVRTSRHIVSLEQGLPNQQSRGGEGAQGHPAGILTLTTKEEGAEAVGMCVWATGLAQNPFVENCFKAPALSNTSNVISANDAQQDATTTEWKLAKDEKTGSLVTDQQLRVLLEPTSPTTSKTSASPQANLTDVFAIGDCAMMQNSSYPATAQVASQKAYWLAARLNKGNLSSRKFEWKNLGTMAYLGGWTGIAQGIGGLGDVSGRTAWFIWKGAYLVKTLSWRNKILVLVYWLTNWASGRDVSRF